MNFEFSDQYKKHFKGRLEQAKQAVASAGQVRLCACCVRVCVCVCVLQCLQALVLVRIRRLDLEVVVVWPVACMNHSWRSTLPLQPCVPGSPAKKVCMTIPLVNLCPCNGVQAAQSKQIKPDALECKAGRAMFTVI